MSNVKYLRDGSIVEFKQEVEGGFLVEEYMEFLIPGRYPDDGDQWDRELSGNCKIVSEIFDAAPTQIYDKQLSEKKVELERIQNEHRKVSSDLYAKKVELEKVTKQTEDHSKWIFDLKRIKEAKRIIFIANGDIYPTIIQKDFKSIYSGYDGSVLTFSISANAGDPVFKTYKIYDGSRDWNSTEVDQDFGLKFDLTDEEITLEVFKRNEKVDPQTIKWASKFERKLGGVVEQYLPQNLLDRYKQLEKENKETAVKNNIKKIKELQSQLEELNKTLSPEPYPMPDIP